MNSCVLKTGISFLFLSLWVTGVQAASLQIINNDRSGEGFNDETRVAPVGGNPGTTLGQQRLNALRFAANQLGATLASTVTIQVAAEFNPPSTNEGCSRSSATLASAGTTRVVSDFPNAPIADTFYPIALANALSGRDQDTSLPDITADFNSSIDNNSLCLEGVNWYYGYDDSPTRENDLNFISTATHELIHGLGFATFADLESGEFLADSPDVFSRFMLDLSRGAIWPQLTARQRATSATNDGNLVWNGPSTNSQAVSTLDNNMGANQGRIQLFAPFPLQPGSSVSHWDTEVTPNALMEPFDTSDINVTEGIGLSSCLLQDIGWKLINNARCPDGAPSSQQPDSGQDDPDVEEANPPAPTSNPADENSGSGGGGCALAGGAPDPLFPLLILIAALMLRWRRA